MADYGITEEGFVRKPLSQILADLRAGFLEEFGPATNVTEGPLAQHIGLIAAELDQVWQLAEDSYNAGYPSGAVGVPLDNVVMLNAIQRLRDAASTVEVTCGGTPGTVIAEGSIVSDVDTGERWDSEAGAVIGAGGTVDVTFRSENVGPVSAAIGKLTVIETPIAGWDTATNAAAAVEGRLRETDEQLKVRREQSLQKSASATVDAIRANLLNLAGVTFADVFENDKDVTDSAGRPPHSLECVVQGAADDDVAQEIWTSKAGGIQTVGNTSGTATDATGTPRVVPFSRPTDVPLLMEITITKRGAGETPQYPGDGDAQVRAKVLAFALSFFTLGRDCERVAFNAPVLEVAGVVGIAIRASRKPAALASADVPIEATEIASLADADLTIL